MWSLEILIALNEKQARKEQEKKRKEEKKKQAVA